MTHREEGTDSLIGTVIAGRFEILERIGAGGMGKVYRARQAAMERDVALKVLHREHHKDAELVQRFQREMRATSRIDHPNTPHVYDFGVHDDGGIYLALELLRGRSLDDVLIDEAPLPARRVARIGRQIASALAAVHAENITHRDLKPDNIMLIDRADEREVVKVLDFGLAHFEEGIDAARLTAHGHRVGTPQYMAPEYIQDDDFDHRADLYALGVILYQALTGRLPVRGRNLQEVLERARRPPPELPDDCPPWLANVVGALMQRDPDDRPANAQVVIDAFDQGLASGYTEPMAPVRAAQPPPDLRSSLVAGLFGAVTVLGALVIVALLVQGARWILGP